MRPTFRLYFSFLALGLLAGSAGAGPIEDRLAQTYGRLDPGETGVLYDRVLPLSGIERFDGRVGAPPANVRLFRQIYDELRRASSDPAARPTPEALFERAQGRHDAIPIALLFDRYQRIRKDALERGALVKVGESLAPGHGEAYETHTAFVAAALRSQTWRGGEARFVLDPETFFSNAGVMLADLEIDLGDGVGFRGATLGVPLTARYSSTGAKTLRLRAKVGGAVLEASSVVIVRALAAPLPDDTLHVTGTIPYLSGVATGDAYVYLAPGRSSIVNPAIVVEGFDLDNSMNWDELYELLNQEQLLEDLRADGYDAIVLNFTDATDYIQRNAFVLVELLQQVRGTVGPQTTFALAGASMGALVSRYALAYMEVHGLPHSVRTWLSFDGPHQGANIPLGVQYWVKFFSGQSADAAFLLSRLDRPAARQMLVHHYTDPPGSTGQADPLLAGFTADLAAVGNWPVQPRRVAIANGSGAGLGQGFAAGAQIVQWSYSDLFVAVRGHVWAVPNQTPLTRIFDGSIRLLFFPTTQVVNVSATKPYDNAPGGSRATMADMDSTAAPYGDIVALHPSHCFIPTMSALAYDSPDLFHSVASDPDPLAHTPFDMIYVPAVNQEHVQITPENKTWIISEIESGVTGVGGPAANPPLSLAVAPNPSSGPLEMAYSLARAGAVDLRIFDIAGREIAHPVTGSRPAGLYRVTWDGSRENGTSAAPGVYFIHLAAHGETLTRRIVRLR